MCACARAPLLMYLCMSFGEIFGEIFYYLKKTPNLFSLDKAPSYERNYQKIIHPSKIYTIVSVGVLWGDVLLPEKDTQFV